MIEPKILKGFRDTLPDAMIQKKTIIKNFENIFESYGFVPIDTPALEYTEILLGKGGGETDKQIYRFNDHGGRDVALRFDLTVPLARFVSQHYNDLVFPFKRYHIAPVWRGENTQKGRFREFYQCDFDILGSHSLDADLEILLIIKDGISTLNLGDFKIFINNRKILNSLLKKFDLFDKSIYILRTIDKVYKIGIDNIFKELVDEVGIPKNRVEDILSFLNLSDKNYVITDDNIFKTLDKYKLLLGEELSSPVFELEYIFKTLKELDAMQYYAFNPAITRGLDYYTGTVFETFVIDKMNFGSICSGGRYDNLTSLYSKTAISGIGASFGLDRIISILEDKNLTSKKQTKSDAIIFNLDQKLNIEYHKFASILRKYNINVEIVFEKQKLPNQFKIAEKKGIPFAIFIGEEEIKNKKYNLKNLIEKKEYNQVSIEDIIRIIREKNNAI